MKATNDAKFDATGFSYDPETGCIFKDGKRRDVFGPKSRYRRVTAGRLHVKAHRLAWRLYYGRWPSPELEIDHKNLIKHDNRIANLRLATHGQNRANAPLRKAPKSASVAFTGCRCKKGGESVCSTTVKRSGLTPPTKSAPSSRPA